jgi:hypothetical protein
MGHKETKKWWLECTISHAIIHEGLAKQCCQIFHGKNDQNGKKVPNVNKHTKMAKK